MRTIHRMILSDLVKMWRQGLAISILLGCGIAIFVMMTSSMHSLQISQDRYYSQYRFADVFGALTRAPQSIANRMRDVQGVAQVQTRIVHSVLLDMPSMIEPVSCRLVSIGRDPKTELNRIFLRRGRFPNTFGRNEVIASEPFANAHRLNPGDTLDVNMDGRKETLRIVGIGLSPEFVYAVQPGLLLSDDRRFGILWMPNRQMEAAFNMEGAFNDFAIQLLPHASVDEAIFQLDRILGPYGGRGAFPRKDQDSHRRLADEMHQMQSMGYVTPSIFLMVVAFLFNIVLSRMVNQQKDQIATLRAFGYSRVDLAIYYIQFIAILVAIGATLGFLAGWRLSWWMIDTYIQFFRFPMVVYEVAVREALAAIAIGMSAAMLGGFSAIQKVVQLQPAVAMRPDVPRSFGSSLSDQLGLGKMLSPMMRMALRRLEANPTSTAMSILGISMGGAVLVLGSYMRDTIDFVIDIQFGKSQHQDVMLTFNEPLSADSFHDVLHLPGVSFVEPFRAVSVRLHHGLQNYRLGILGLEASPSLYRILDSNQRAIEFDDASGITITQKLAEILDVKLGDILEVEILEKKTEVRYVHVGGIFANYMDPAAYMERHSLHRLMRESERLSGAFVSADKSRFQSLYDEIKKTPTIAGVIDNNSARKNFRELIDQATRIMRTVNSIFGSIIAFGVIYNAALIALAESGRDLATLRVIGFSRREVAQVLMGELFVLTLLAIPLGLLIGYFFSYLATLALDTESHRFPLVIHRATMAYSTLVVLVAAAASAFQVRRMLDRLDLIAVLKVKQS